MQAPFVQEQSALFFNLELRTTNERRPQFARIGAAFAVELDLIAFGCNGMNSATQPGCPIFIL